MGHNNSHPELATTVRACPDCDRDVKVATRNGMVFHHLRGKWLVGEHPPGWCPGGGIDWHDPGVRLQDVPAMAPHRGGSGCEALHSLGTELAPGNPRLAQLYLWDNPQCLVIRPPVSLNEWNGTYSWLAKVTSEVWPVVRSRTTAYRVAKMMHVARWPAGTPELPDGVLIRRRLEREAKA